MALPDIDVPKLIEQLRAAAKAGMPRSLPAHMEVDMMVAIDRVERCWSKVQQALAEPVPALNPDAVRLLGTLPG